MIRVDIKRGNGVSMSFLMSRAYWSSNIYGISFFSDSRLVYVGLVFSSVRDVLYLYKFSKNHYGHFMRVFNECKSLYSGKQLLIFLKGHSVEKIDIGYELEFSNNLKEE